jgi:hypothetical protein
MIGKHGLIAKRLFTQLDRVGLGGYSSTNYSRKAKLVRDYNVIHLTGAIALRCR